jgi:hypothetical protein
VQAAGAIDVLHPERPRVAEEWERAVQDRRLRGIEAELATHRGCVDGVELIHLWKADDHAALSHRRFDGVVVDRLGRGAPRARPVISQDT